MHMWTGVEMGGMSVMGDDKCYECTGYGDDYYWDEEQQTYVNACVDCPYNGEVMADDECNEDW